MITRGAAAAHHFPRISPSDNATGQNWPIVEQHFAPRDEKPTWVECCGLAPLSPKKFIQLQEGRQTSCSFVGGKKIVFGDKFAS